MYNRLSSDKEESWQLASMFLEPCKLFLSSENNMLIRKYGWQGEAVFLEIEIQLKGGGELPVGIFLYQLCSVQLLSRVRLCNPMDCRTPGSAVHHQLSELAQTHVHWVGDAIQASHPLSSPSPYFLRKNKTNFSKRRHSVLFLIQDHEHQFS